MGLVVDAFLHGSPLVYSKHGDQPNIPILQVQEKHVWCNSSWIQEELTSKGLQATEQVYDGEFGKETEKKNWQANESLYKAQQKGKEEKEMFDVHSNSQDDVSEAVALVALLKDCAKQKDLQKGSKLHADIVGKGLLETNVFIGSILVSMYAKCGALEKAQEVFNELPFQNVVSWNALIGGYAQLGHGEKALNCYEQMQLRGFSPDAVTYVFILNACGSIGAFNKGEEIHAEVDENFLLETNVVVANALIDMYGKCGLLAKAQKVFDELQVRDTVTWNGLIAGYAQHGHGEEALNCYERMLFEGFFPDEVTFICMLKACGGIGAADMGQCIHAQIVKGGLLETNILASNALLDMYAKCGLLSKAQKLFDELSVCTTVSWNALISGYAQHEYSEEALKCFDWMQSEGFSPDAVTFACILKACAIVEMADKGLDLHAQIAKTGFLGNDVHVGTALVDMYAKCGLLATAQEVFDKLGVRGAVTWNSLIAGYAQHEYGEEALSCFDQMQREGFSPSSVTFTCILKACGSIGAICKGQSIHSEIEKHGLLDRNVIIDTGLVDMYASCGMLAEAQYVFDKLSARNVVSWSALMVGYAQHGEDEIVFDLFNKLIGGGTDPDLVTYTILLSTCSHRGLLDKGQTYFEIITKAYGIVPTLDLFTCMVDLFGRAGHFDKVVAVMKEMPVPVNVMLWQTLLGACGKWDSTKLGRWVFERAILVDHEDAGTYVSMSNMYAAA